jgi:phosphohistidine phosphatase
MTEVKRLLLLRHAKSSWNDPELADYDRPLSARGRKAAKLVGAYLRREQIQTSLALCSSARRARETLDLVAVSGEIQIERELYGASPSQLLARLRRVPDGIDAVMLIGHNPAIHDLAVALITDTSELAARRFPTGALATLTLRGSWRALEPGARGVRRLHHATRVGLTGARRCRRPLTTVSARSRPRRHSQPRLRREPHPALG